MLRSLLPSGRPLPSGVQQRRHRTVSIVLALHLPALLVLGLSRHFGVARTFQLAAPAALAILLALKLGNPRTRALATTVGLAWCSFAVERLSGGAPEAHLHTLAAVCFVALYQDWLPFLAFTASAAAAYAIPAYVDPGLVFAPGAALRRPFVWSAVHVATLLAVQAALIAFWHATEEEQEHGAQLAVDLAHREVAEREAEVARRARAQALVTNLARRNQSLIGRQLSTLDELEHHEKDADVLAGLFRLDHLATRMRRNVENLLVLAGAGGGRLYAQPVPVSELLRGAVAEVEQYERVNVAVDTTALVMGPVVSDVAHLLAELLDNALACSPPKSRVAVGASAGERGGVRIWVSDHGVGMTAARLAEQNALLARDPDEDDEEVALGATLGFPVVRRLAARHGITVTLAVRPDGGQGLVASVMLPGRTVLDGPPPAPAVPAAPVRPAATTAAPLLGRRAPRRAPAEAPAPKAAATPVPRAVEGYFVPAPIAGTPASDDAAPPAGRPAPAAAQSPARRAPAAKTPAAPAPAAATPAPAPADGAPDGVPSLLPPSTRSTLARRVPQQALREAGGTTESTVTNPAAVAEPASVAPERASSLLASYRGGVDRARDPKPDAPAVPGSDADGDGSREQH